MNSRERKYHARKRINAVALALWPVVVDRTVLSAQPPLSYRSFTDVRAADFGFSASLAHVFVQVVGGSRTVTTAAAPAVMPVSAQTMLTVTGGSVTGATTIPLSAGQFTYVTLLAN